MTGERLETQVVEEESEATSTLQDATQTAEPPVQKRPTVASIKKELDGLKQDMNRDVLEWLGQLDVRIEDVETRTAQHNAALLGDVKTRLDIIEKGGQKTIIEVADDVLRRVETVEADTSTLANVMRSHIADTEATPPMAAATAGFATPPTQPEEPAHTGLGIQAIAAKCQTMNDVLMICRAMQGDQTLTDEERKAVIKTATTAASVQTTSGLQIRAGVRNIGA